MTADIAGSLVSNLVRNLDDRVDSYNALYIRIFSGLVLGCIE